MGCMKEKEKKFKTNFYVKFHLVRKKAGVVFFILFLHTVKYILTVTDVLEKSSYSES